MESTREPNLEQLTVLFDLLTREYAAANDDQRKEIAADISELTARISAVKSRPLRES